MKMESLRVNRLTLTILFSALFFLVPAQTFAGAKLVPVQGASYNVNAPMKDNLSVFMGKKVYIHLKSGTTLSGFVKEIGEHFIHLEKLDKKDFFDALISIESISAIDARFREYEK